MTCSPEEYRVGLAMLYERIMNNIAKKPQDGPTKENKNEDDQNNMRTEEGELQKMHLSWGSGEILFLPDAAVNSHQYMFKYLNSIQTSSICSRE